MKTYKYKENGKWVRSICPKPSDEVNAWASVFMGLLFFAFMFVLVIIGVS